MYTDSSVACSVVVDPNAKESVSFGRIRIRKKILIRIQTRSLNKNCFVKKSHIKHLKAGSLIRIRKGPKLLVGSRKKFRILADLDPDPQHYFLSQLPEFSFSEIIKTPGLLY
jgi:hypothetical protein